MLWILFLCVYYADFLLDLSQILSILRMSLSHSHSIYKIVDSFCLCQHVDYIYFHWNVADVWGFDDAAVQVLQNMKPQDLEVLTYKYAVLLDPDSGLLPKNNTSKSVSISYITLHKYLSHLPVLTLNKLCMFSAS